MRNVLCRTQGRLRPKILRMENPRVTWGMPLEALVSYNLGGRRPSCLALEDPVSYNVGGLRPSCHVRRCLGSPSLPQFGRSKMPGSPSLPQFRRSKMPGSPSLPQFGRSPALMSCPKPASEHIWQRSRTLSDRAGPSAPRCLVLTAKPLECLGYFFEICRYQSRTPF